MSPKASAYLQGVAASSNIAPPLSTPYIEAVVSSKPLNNTNRIVGTPSFWKQKSSIHRHSLLNRSHDNEYIKSTDEEIQEPDS